MTHAQPHPTPQAESPRSRTRGPHIRFFWQLILAFALVILLAGGGTILAGRLALSHLESFVSDNPHVVTELWVERLAAYYVGHGSWEGVDELIAGYPCQPEWAPWDARWQASYALASPDGSIVSSNNADLVGSQLRHLQLRLSVPILVDDRLVGRLFLNPLVPPDVDLYGVQAFVRQRFLLVGLAIGAFAAAAGLGFSRVISQPVVHLTEATRAVAAGDLSVRVPGRYHGEIGELAAAFNRMTEELARADELRRNLTADVAHELRTPLSVIRGKLEGVLDGVYPATPEHVEPILDETQVLIHLVEDLRLLALAETGQLALDRRPMDVGDLLRDTQVNFGPQAADRGITLALDLPSELPKISADWRRISQVLGNLLTNAVRHTPQGGCVTLSAAATPAPAGEEAGRAVEVAVTDTGTGIPPEDIPYIFERFWRGDRSRSRAGGGTGLGLAIARQLVEMHGGTIHVESTPGQGSKFRFTLPTRPKTSKVLTQSNY